MKKCLECGRELEFFPGFRCPGCQAAEEILAAQTEAVEINTAFNLRQYLAEWRNGDYSRRIALAADRAALPRDQYDNILDGSEEI